MESLPSTMTEQLIALTSTGADHMSSERRDCCLKLSSFLANSMGLIFDPDLQPHAGVSGTRSGSVLYQKCKEY